MLGRIDQYLLDCCEKFSHMTQRRFGLDCFWWARLSVIVGCFFLPLMFVLMNNFNPASFLIWVIITSYEVYQIEQAEKSFLKSSVYSKKKLWWGRMFSIAFSIMFFLLMRQFGQINIYFRLFQFACVFWPLIEYFKVCEPLSLDKNI